MTQACFSGNEGSQQYVKVKNASFSQRLDQSTVQYPFGSHRQTCIEKITINIIHFIYYYHQKQTFATVISCMICEVYISDHNFCSLVCISSTNIITCVLVKKLGKTFMLINLQSSIKQYVFLNEYNHCKEEGRQNQPLH